VAKPRTRNPFSRTHPAASMQLVAIVLMLSVMAVVTASVG
jgi:hypothetical protein